MATVPVVEQKLKMAERGAAIAALFAPIFCVLCIRVWNSADPWSRVNIFSVGYAALISVSYIEQSFVFLRSAFRTESTLKEAIGAIYDPVLVRASLVLGFFDYAYLLEYVHWRFAPFLIRVPLQWAGLVAAAGSLAMLGWADRWLSRHFADDIAAGKLMTGGPYRFVRHPRYVSIILSKVAAPLMLGSLLAWIALPLWLVLVFRRIRLEEAHLRSIFGADYGSYASRTARLFPGIY